MTTLRFEYQRQCVGRVLDELDFTDPLDNIEPRRDLIVNIGANTDPACLKRCDPQRVINCDLFADDEIYEMRNGQPVVVSSHLNAVDEVFDAARDRWPFNDGTAALVVLGDILEHMTPADIAATLREARRVGRRLCVTVPEDDRPETDNDRADLYRRGAVHRTIVTEPLLRGLLERTGWRVTSWEHPEYDSGVHWGKQVWGHFVEAE